MIRRIVETTPSEPFTPEQRLELIDARNAQANSMFLTKHKVGTDEWDGKRSDPSDPTNGSPDFYEGYHNPNLDDDGENLNQSKLNDHPAVISRGIRTTDHDYRNLPGSAASTVAGSPAAYTGKPKIQTKKFGYKDGSTTNPKSDNRAQDSFESLVDAARHVDSKLQFTNDQGLSPIQAQTLTKKEKKIILATLPDRDQEQIVSDFIIEYLTNAGITPNIDPERLARALAENDGSKAIRKLDKKLTEAAMRAHTAYIMRLGKTIVSSFDNPSSSGETNIPVAVQRRGRIIPTTRRQRRLIGRGGKLQSERFHIGSMNLAYRDVDADKLDLDNLRMARRREEERRRKMVHIEDHHLHHNDHQFQDLAFGRRKVKIGVPKTPLKVTIRTPRNITKKLHKAAKQAERKGSTMRHETVNQRMDRMRRQAATRAGR